MANLFSRIKNTVLADLHDALDHKEQKNPIALLNQYLRECEQETEKVRKLLERQYQLKDEFTREYRQAVTCLLNGNTRRRSLLKQEKQNSINLLSMNKTI